MVEETPVKKKAPAGWYNDPRLVNTRRYWDGQKWTENRIESSDPAAPPRNPAAAKTTPAASSKGWMVWVAIVFAIVVVWSIIGSLGGSDGPDTGAGGSGDAKHVCENSVKDQLKAPATAKFSGAKATLGSDNTWTVTGSVDSENSFGALVRSQYTCSAIHGTGLNWRTKSTLLN